MVNLTDVSAHSYCVIVPLYDILSERTSSSPSPFFFLFKLLGSVRNHLVVMFYVTRTNNDKEHLLCDLNNQHLYY